MACCSSGSRMLCNSCSLIESDRYPFGGIPSARMREQMRNDRSDESRPLSTHLVTCLKQPPTDDGNTFRLRTSHRFPLEFDLSFRGGIQQCECRHNATNRERSAIGVTAGVAQECFDIAGHGRFVALERYVTQLMPDGTGTFLTAVHEHLPPGVEPADNELGWREALKKPAALLRPASCAEAPPISCANSTMPISCSRLTHR